MNGSQPETGFEQSQGLPLRARRMGIHTHHVPVVFMRADCHVCRSEGLSANSRVLLQAGRREVIATLFQVSSDLLEIDEAGLSETAWNHLQVADGVAIFVRHPDPVESFGRVRARIFGQRLEQQAFAEVMKDVAAGRYSDVELSAFLTATAAVPLDEAETIGLTRSMVEAGERLRWSAAPVVDKHCVGGLPGNRTTPIVVAIVAAHGLVMPKTSSRAITSPAGTADTMETMAPVDLGIEDIRRVVERESGCVVWGGAVRLSPVDDIFIRVERALNIDSEGQLVASVMSKKIAAGSTHLVVDIPVGPTAKVRSPDAADALGVRLSAVARTFGLEIRTLLTDGSQPVGRGIGPALEARDVLAVLRREEGAPNDLRLRACTLAAELLELGGRAKPGEGRALAELTIADGRAWAKFQRICEAQGGMRVPPVARHRSPLVAGHAGVLRSIDSRRIARIAKLAGAPGSKAAGVEMHVRLGDRVDLGEPLCTVYSESTGELQYALDYAGSVLTAFGIDREAE